MLYKCIENINNACVVPKLIDGEGRLPCQPTFGPYNKWLLRMFCHIWMCVVSVILPVCWQVVTSKFTIHWCLMQVVWFAPNPPSHTSQSLQVSSPGVQQSNESAVAHSSCRCAKCQVSDKVPKAQMKTWNLYDRYFEERFPMMTLPFHWMYWAGKAFQPHWASNYSSEYRIWLNYSSEYMILMLMT